MTIPVILFTLFSCIISLVAPWIGVLAYYGLSVGQMSSMFPQDFGEARISLYLSLAILAGLGVATATQQVDWRRLLHLPNILLMILVVMANLSFHNSPFDGFFEFKISELRPEEMISTFNKMVLIYFASALLIDTRFKLTILLVSFAGVLLYYAAWANKVYLTQEFWLFGINGRLGGPLNSSYFDENYLGMMYVFATPVFYYFSMATKSRIIRYGLWVSILASWHALFLTGSRGALFSLSIVCIFIFFRSYSKRASVILIVALAAAIVDQSGGLIERITNTVSYEEVEQERAFIENTDDNISEVIIDPRILSWRAGVKMIKDYPVFGVGIGNFVRAYSSYQDGEPYVAHNTFLEFAATTGVASGLIYLYFLLLRLNAARKKADPNKTYTNGLPRDYLDDLITGLFIGFFCVSLFLDLMIYEVLYFVLLVGYCKYSVDKPRKAPKRWLVDSIYKLKPSLAPYDVVVEAPADAELAQAKIKKKPVPLEGQGLSSSQYVQNLDNSAKKHAAG